MSQIKVVTYASVVTKMHPGSPPDPWGPGVTRGAPGGQPQTSLNQKILVSKVVGYASVVKNNPPPWRVNPGLPRALFITVVFGGQPQTSLNQKFRFQKLLDMLQW